MKTPIASLVAVIGIYRVKYPGHFILYDNTNIFVPGLVQELPLISQQDYEEIVRPFVDNGGKIKEVFFVPISPLGVIALYIRIIRQKDEKGRGVLLLKGHTLFYPITS